MTGLAERKGRGRKISIVHIAQILLSESDAEHPLSQQQILAFLRERYGMEMDRKAVRRNLEALRGGGLPVVCREVERVIEGKPAPLSLDWYWDHDLTKEDMKALIDLLYFSHLPAAEVRQLAQKLKNLYMRPFDDGKTAAVEEENTQKEKAPALQAARLGDTLDIWTAAYGAPAGDTVYMKRFNNGTVTVIVFKEHIVNITLSDPAGPSKAPQDYKDFIPEDSILQNTKEEQDEKGSYKTEMYTSFSLEKAFPLSEGKFAVVTAQSRTDGKYLATVIDCTPLSQ